MTKDEALKHLKLMAWTLQKFRSNAKDPLFGVIDPPGTPGLAFTETFAGETWPWVFGDKCPLVQLMSVLDRAEETGVLAPADYVNFMFVLDRFMPEVKVATAFFGGREGEGIPEGPPDINILRGWTE